MCKFAYKNGQLVRQLEKRGGAIRAYNEANLKHYNYKLAGLLEDPEMF